ncbi:hypothetical protein EV215_1752 [Hypnocyclicus thermotrophus]|uniref:Uncharacterized protein n=1 Tax=Hypnocyclicus thermotrophus TaxID=1627895 RepID=A0AA46DXC5_9FUSO|nr:hypothetical protein EV215_1752 [Hypnocyclicus thermotrophus]
MKNYNTLENYINSLPNDRKIIINKFKKNYH